MASSSRHLLNPLAPLSEPTPSALDGIPPELERKLRSYGALLIQQAGIMLKAPQVVMSTAQVLFQRFWFVTSLKHFGIRDIGMGALFLSSKLEESPLRLRDIINSFHYLSHLSLSCSSPPFPSPSSYKFYIPMDYFATEFYDLKDALVIAEMQILKRLGFQTQCGLPYGHLVNYLKVLELEANKELVEMSWGFLNDMMQTPAPALYPQSTLSLTSLYLSSRLVSPRISLPLAPVPWWELFDATERDLVDVAGMLGEMYQDWGMTFPGVRTEEEREGGEKEKENVWRKAKGLPVTKRGVRELLDKLGTNENGSK
ncbi:uncharacterized protein JCM6883_003383 [Sporobolomyces salmoneus]|uniref:uncharacterized protein n=1 Tax=Sporobolomyces salmoneus TaxID=183962 RepID=UPI0031790466